MIPSSLAGIIIWNGGLSLPPLETIMLRIVRTDLDPLIYSYCRALGAPVNLDTVQDALFPSLFAVLPAGWTFVDANRGVPQVHLQYSGPGLDGTPFAGTVADVFLCIATSSKAEPARLRTLYVRDLPMPGADEPGRYAQPPYNAEAAWLTLFVWDSANIRTSWKGASSVPGYFTFEGEVLASALI